MWWSAARPKAPGSTGKLAVVAKACRLSSTPIPISSPAPFHRAHTTPCDSSPRTPSPPSTTAPVGPLHRQTHAHPAPNIALSPRPHSLWRRAAWERVAFCRARRLRPWSGKRSTHRDGRLRTGGKSGCARCVLVRRRSLRPVRFIFTVQLAAPL